jgi:gliding motility-associated-like protein
LTYSSSNSGVITILGIIATIHGVGTSDITARQAGNTTYAPGKYIKTFSVSQAELTFTAESKSKVYLEPNPVLTYTISGFVYSENQSVLNVLPSIQTAAVQNSPVGKYLITLNGGSDNNYHYLYDDDTLTITKASQTITFPTLPDKTYGNEDFSPGATASSGLTVSYTSDNLSVATIISGMIHIVGVGSATITASQSGNTNYNPAAPDVPQTLTVDSADLTFTADNKTKIYLDANPILTYTISGFVNDETESVLDVPPVIQTTALQNSPVNDYPITISGGNDNNYTYIYIAGILSITKIPQTITFTDVPEKLLVSDSYTLAATSTAGLTVSFESMDEDIATVSGTELTGVAKGNVQIRAYSTGDGNHDAAEAFADVEVYSTHKDIMYLFTPNNDGFNDLWELPEMSTWGNCDVKVYNRWGKLVYDNKNYNNTWDGTSGGKPVPEGPYYFVIKTENAGTVKGTVNIVR